MATICYSVMRLLTMVFALALMWASVANAGHVCAPHACDSTSVSAFNTGHDQPATQDRLGDKLMCKFVCHAQHVAVVIPAVHVQAQLSSAGQPVFSPAVRLLQPSASPDQPPRTA